MIKENHQGDSSPSASKITHNQISSGMDMMVIDDNQDSPTTMRRIPFGAAAGGQVSRRVTLAPANVSGQESRSPDVSPGGMIMMEDRSQSYNSDGSD